jgi:hypothetical protein
MRVKELENEREMLLLEEAKEKESHRRQVAELQAEVRDKS